MKKILFILLTVSGLLAQAQHFEAIQLDELPDGVTIFSGTYCFDNAVSGIIVYGKNGCDSHWEIVDSANNTQVLDNVDSIVLYNHQVPDMYNITYTGCTTNLLLLIHIHTSPQSPFAEPTTWKRQNESITLESGGYDGVWSTGEVAESITVSAPGTYSVTLTNDCGSATYSVEVRDNVELYRATVDLRTNKNKVTWLATPEQAEYITEVKVYRDGNLVGTAPYANGYFLDAIGSDAAARTYQIVGVSVEGDDCPIASYQKGTIHTTYYLDVNNDLNMTWNAPYIQEEAEGQLTGYQIYKYNPATEELTLIDEVNTTITNYTCSANAFFGGRALLAATFDRVSPPSGGDGQRPAGAESRSFSNPSENMFAVGEETLVNFKVYPNPTNGAFTIEGVKDVTVYNTLGQAVASSRSEVGTHTFTLQTGIYFVKSNEGVVKKVVVE